MTMKIDAASVTKPMFRHELWVRITHWVNAISFVFLAVSGVAILLALPQLYWGNVGYEGLESWLTLPLEKDLNQTHWGRNYHFLFAWIFVVNGFIYLVMGLIRSHLYTKLLPNRSQLKPKAIFQDIWNHLRLKTPKGEEAMHYNLLQKLVYLVVLIVLCPLMLLSGLSMSPAITSAFPEILDFFGGRHSGRSIHFISAALLVLFLVIHLFEIFLAGFSNEVRSMITGFYQVPEEKE